MGRIENNPPVAEGRDFGKPQPVSYLFGTRPLLHTMSSWKKERARLSWLCGNLF